MATTRLTNSIRKEILDSIILHSKYSAKERKKLDTKLFQTGDKVYNFLYGSIQKDLEAIPKGFLHKDNHLQVQTDDGFMRIYFSESKAVPLGFGICADYMNKKTPKLIKEYIAIQKEIQEFKKAANAAKGEIQVILDSASTLKRLLEIWPPVKDFIPVHIINPTIGINLPAVITTELADKIDLKL